MSVDRRGRRRRDGRRRRPEPGADRTRRDPGRHQTSRSWPTRWPASAELPDEPADRRPGAGRRRGAGPDQHRGRRRGAGQGRLSSSRTSRRTGRSSARCSAALDAACEPETIFIVNTSAIPITRVGCDHRPPGAGDRGALHEPGADEAGGGADPRRPHLGGDGRAHPGAAGRDGQARGRRQGLLRLHLQPAVARAHERGRVPGLRGRGHRRGGGRGVPQLLRAPDGPAGDRRPDRRGHGAGQHRGDLPALRATASTGRARC